jgi:cytochrome bd-type quinol oxidase subunit 1
MKTQKMAIISLFLCGIIAFWSSHALGEDLTAEQKEVWAAVQANWETFKKGDVEAALAIKHDEMIAWFSSNPDPLKKEYLREAYNNWFNWFVPTFFKLEPQISIFLTMLLMFFTFIVGKVQIKKYSTKVGN